MSYNNRFILSPDFKKRSATVLSCSGKPTSWSLLDVRSRDMSGREYTRTLRRQRERAPALFGWVTESAYAVIGWSAPGGEPEWFIFNRSAAAAYAPDLLQRPPGDKDVPASLYAWSLHCPSHIAEADIAALVDLPQKYYADAGHVLPLLMGAMGFDHGGVMPIERLSEPEALEEPGPECRHTYWVVSEPGKLFVPEGAWPFADLEAYERRVSLADLLSS